MAEHTPTFAFPSFQTATINIISRFLANNGDNPHLFNKEDVQLTQLNARVERIRRIPNISDDNVYNALVKSLKWRKAEKVNELTESDIPREYFQIGAIFQYGKDVRGSTMMVFRVKMHEQFLFHQWLGTLKKYMIFLFERIEKSLINEDKGGMTLVFDCQGAILECLNIKLITFIMNTLRDHYPGMLTGVIVYKFPPRFDWILNAFIEHIPKEQEIVVDVVKTEQELLRCVNLEELPDFMGGINQLPYRFSPDNAPAIKDYAKTYNIEVKEYLEYLKKCMPK